MTSGGTYGPGWQVGDSAPVRLDIGNVGDSSGGPGIDVLPPTVIPDDDPTGWTYDQTEATYYRSPTQLEMIDNPWLSAQDLLIIPPRPALQALSDGDGNVDLPIPLYEEFEGRPQENLSFRTLQLGKIGTKENIPFIEQRWEDDCLRRTTLDVSFSLYESRGFDSTDINLDDIVGSAVSSATRDSLAILGATQDLSFWLRGPYHPSRVQLELGLPPSETHFYVLRTEFDPTPGQLLAGSGSGSGSPLLLDGSPSNLTTSSSSIAVPQHCSDGMPNGSEVDVDCGGPDCAPCDIGEMCQQSSDCISGLCYFDKGNIPGVCTSQCTDGLDNDPDGFADTCDFSCVEHPDFRTDTVVHRTPLEHATTIGQFGTMHYCTVNDLSYLSSFFFWSANGTHILNNVIPDDETILYEDEDRPPPFIVSMRGCVFADNTSTAENCDVGIDNCPSHPGYPLAPISTSNWGSATTGGLGQASGVLGRVWPLVDYTVEQGSVTDTTPIQIAVVYPQQRDASLSTNSNGVAVGYVGPQTPVTAGAAISYWNNPFAGFNFAHEVGHTIGLSHENGPGEGSVYPGTFHSSFMSTPAGPAPVLDENADSLVTGLNQWATWILSAAKDVPRATGFSFVGCNSDDSICQTGHPGLTCDEGTQTCR